jgi:hypothetical protein
MAGTAAPYVKLQFFDNNGAVANGYQLFIYEAGTTTKATTYTNSSLSALNTNPIILDSAGRCVIFLAEAGYKFVLADPTDTDPPTSPLWTVDGIQGLPSQVANIEVDGLAGEALAVGEVAYMSDGSGALTAGDWYLATSDNNYASVDAPSIGFVTVGGGIGDTITVRTAGRYTGLVGLAKGTVYYVDATPGAISASDVQQNRLPLCQADTTTSVILPIGGTVSISIKAALATFAYSGVIGTNHGNDATDTDTLLTDYVVSIPDNFLDTPGATLVIEGTLAGVAAGTARVRTMKVQVGASGLLTVFTNSANVANEIIPFRFNLIRRTATTGAITGLFFKGAAHAGAPTVYLSNFALAGGSAVDWTTQQDFEIYLATDTAGHANDIFLTELYVYQTRSPYGTLV